MWCYNILLDSARCYAIRLLIVRDVVSEIIDSNYKKEGILMCGTGIGIAITANKFPGIYAAACYDTYATKRARLSNNSIVITLGGRITSYVLTKRILKTWLSLEFRTPIRSTPKIAIIK